jgi:hypothetical protein
MKIQTNKSSPTHQAESHNPTSLENSTGVAKLIQRAKLDSNLLTVDEVMQLHKTLGNHQLAQLLPKTGKQESNDFVQGRTPAMSVQRDYIDLSEGSRLPTQGIELGSKVGVSTQSDGAAFHIFAHSSGESLFEIQDVADMNATAFAKWLSNNGRVYSPKHSDWGRTLSYNIYIHACASSAFAGKVKAALVALNESNESINVYGTVGISATWIDGRPIVIPMEHSKSWLKFEEKLAQGKVKKKEAGDIIGGDLEYWKKIFQVYPNGYIKY